jgi:HPt (histidine-containing phosphotransfer) domain-containing protein
LTSFDKSKKINLFLSKILASRPNIYLESTIFIIELVLFKKTMMTDLTYLKNMSGGNQAVMKEMIGIFIEQVNEISNEMLLALKEEDWLSLSRLAHKAKSSVAIMGMTEMESELKRLERIAGEGKEIEEFKKLVEKFNADSHIAIKELENFTKSN